MSLLSLIVTVLCFSNNVFFIPQGENSSTIVIEVVVRPYWVSFYHVVSYHEVGESIVLPLGGVDN